MASKLPKKYFTKFKKPLVDLPNLIEFQKDSFKWFREKGLKELFEDISPIKDFTEKELELHFIDYSIGEPNYDDQYAKDHNLSYEAPLKTRFSLVNKRTKEKKEQEVFFGNIFLMTERGTFVINGVERVLISQLARSFGVYFNSVFYRGKNYFGAKIIPSRGSWIEIQTEPNGVIYARIDRKRKFLVTSLLRFFNLEKDQDIKECFKERDRGEIKFIDETIKEDPAKSQSEGIAEMYSKIRPGEPASPEAAKEFISKMFSKERYDLSLAGRHRLNRRLGLPLEGNDKNTGDYSGQNGGFGKRRACSASACESEAVYYSNEGIFFDGPAFPIYEPGKYSFGGGAFKATFRFGSGGIKQGKSRH